MTSLTISRTLSLRGHHEPEWANQTVKVTRPEDIVINRDREDTSAPPVLSEREMEEGRVVGATENGSDVTQRPTEAEGSTEQGGDVEVREWCEGRHLVREYHPKDPREEVKPLHHSKISETDTSISGSRRSHPGCIWKFWLKEFPGRQSELCCCRECYTG